MTKNETILLSDDVDGTRILTLNRPQRRNALDSALLRALIAALHAADADATVRCIVLAGAGTCFCSGADLSEFKGDKADPQQEAERGDLSLELLLSFGRLRVPVVCAVNGPAIGFGAALTNVADLVVMGTSARMGYPELRHGMVPTLMIPVVQALLLGKKAFELLALGDALDADQAVACGLANVAVADDQVLPRALEFGARLGGLDRQLVRETKQLYASMSSMSLSDALRFGREAARRRVAELRQPAV